MARSSVPSRAIDLFDSIYTAYMEICVERNPDILDLDPDRDPGGRRGSPSMTIPRELRDKLLDKFEESRHAFYDFCNNEIVAMSKMVFKPGYNPHENQLIERYNRAEFAFWQEIMTF